MTMIACLLNSETPYLHGCENKGSLEAHFCWGILKSCTKGDLSHFFNVLSKTGHFTHNNAHWQF